MVLLLSKSQGDARVLITGFEPFDGMNSNHSWDVARSCSGDSVNASIHSKILTVDERGSRLPAEDILSGNFDAVILLGIAMDRTEINIEIRAKNTLDMRTRDNSGRQLRNSSIQRDAEEYIDTTFNLQFLREFADDHDDVVLSTDCGNFVCNEAYFRTLSAELLMREQNQIKLPILFIHLPPIERIPLQRQTTLVTKLLRGIAQVPTVNVVGALIKDRLGRVLACRRPPGDKRSGFWEFPGGKIEEHENPLDAVEREVLEELAISVSAKKQVAKASHIYDDGLVVLRVVDCGVVDPSLIVLKEHDMSRWLERCELDSLNWLPADLPIVRRWMEEGVP